MQGNPSPQLSITEYIILCFAVLQFLLKKAATLYIYHNTYFKYQISKWK